MKNKVKVIILSLLLSFSMSANALLAHRRCPNLQQAEAEYKLVSKSYNKKALQELLTFYIACGLDPSKILEAANFGGFGGYPNLEIIPQSLGGDLVSPS